MTELTLVDVGLAFFKVLGIMAALLAIACFAEWYLLEWQDLEGHDTQERGDGARPGSRDQPARGRGG